MTFEHVELDRWDTDAIGFDAGLGGSIQSRLSSTVAYEVAQNLKRALVSFVARHHGWPEDGLRLQGEEVLRTDIEERVNWRRLLRETGESVTGARTSTRTFAATSPPSRRRSPRSRSTRKRAR